MTFKRFFALLFILSLSVFLFFQFYHQPEPLTHGDKKTQIHQKSNSPSFSIETDFIGENNFVILVSLITSIFSFFGFTISTYFSFKGHRRDEELFNLQREKERLEMEKIQAEIQALSRN